METSPGQVSARRASFDIDGVVNMGTYPGVRPGPLDVIITGRSYEEREETEAFLERLSTVNEVFFSPLPFELKTRRRSGFHKAFTINRLNKDGYNIVIHYEDDPIQAEIICTHCPDLQVVILVHDLVEKENVRHSL
jgi:hypothetical protein